METLEQVARVAAVGLGGVCLVTGFGGLLDKSVLEASRALTSALWLIAAGVFMLVAK